MTMQPQVRLEAAIGAGLTPEAISPRDLTRSCDLWVGWCRREGRDARRLTGEAAAAYLAHLLETGCTRSAHARFAMFQVVAGLVWGPEACGCLAPVLRAARVTKKAPPADRWTRAAGQVARLPVSWREPFRNLLEVSRDRPGQRGTLVWSAARIESVAAALTRFNAFATATGALPVPTAALCPSWAETLTPKASAISISTYLERVVDGFERVLTPGLVYDAAAAIADRWAVMSGREARRKGKTARIVPATDLDRLGFEMMAQADAAQVRRISEATLYRDGLLLSLAATLPERARALSALVYDVTLFLEPDGVIRFAIPGEVRKVREHRKSRRPFHACLRRPSLHRALARWRAVYRPMFDGGDWLWPSRLDRNHGMTEATLSQRAARVTEARLGRRVSLHLVRDCVATEIVETDPVSGPTRATAVLGHRDPNASDYYVLADGIVVATAWQAEVAARGEKGRDNLII